MKQLVTTAFGLCLGAVAGVILLEFVGFIIGAIAGSIIGFCIGSGYLESSDNREQDVFDDFFSSSNNSQKKSFYSKTEKDNKKEQKTFYQNDEGSESDSSKNAFATVQRPRERLADVAGMAHVKEQFYEMVIMPLREPELYKKYGIQAGGEFCCMVLPELEKLILSEHWQVNWEQLSIQ